MWRSGPPSTTTSSRSWGWKRHRTNGSNGSSNRHPQQQQQHRPPSLVQTARGRRASMAVACLSLLLYLMLVGPHYYARRRRQRATGIGGAAAGGGVAYEALGSPLLGRQRHHRQAGEDCLEVDVLLPAAAHQEEDAPLSRIHRPIPLLATNLDYDTESYLTRLVDGGWYAGPSGSRIARHKLIVTGGCDPFVLAQLEALKAAHPDLTVFRQREPLGCAAGWNRVLDFLTFNQDVEWAMVFNADIFVPAGALEALAAEVWAAYDRDPLLCRGFFNVTAGQDAVVFVYTRHALATLGKFDENLYPAYYEDYDMDLRHNRTALCSPVARFSSATLHHGPLNSTEYKSGTSVMRDRMRQQAAAAPAEEERKALRAKERELTNRIERGFRSSRLYISLKWGCDHEQAQCAYRHPFNDPALPLSYWRLDWSRRLCIHRQERRPRGCRYILDQAVGPLPHPPLDDQARPRPWLRGYWAGG